MAPFRGRLILLPHCHSLPQTLTSRLMWASAMTTGTSLRSWKCEPITGIYLHVISSIKTKHHILPCRLLESAISLVSSKSTGGKFEVAARTSNSPLKIEYPVSPVDSTLRFNARTSNSPAAVGLHSAYEGTFTITSSLMGPALERHDVEDPAGRGRMRIIDQNTVRRGFMDGKVYWVPAGNVKPEGWVKLRTSNSPAVLRL